MRLLRLILFLTIIHTAAVINATKLTASLVTCSPGPEIYELYGHEAIRIQGIDDNGLPFDSVWNYGVFDFNRPNFIYRFVKGETDYMLAGYPFEWFVEDYRRRGSRVVEQPLNLSDTQVARLRKMLQTEALPQNCTYRYNYILDNCATRVADRVSDVTGDSISVKAHPRFSSFREGMRFYNRNYPWYQFGIDLVLGPGLDNKDYNWHSERYLPLELNRIMSQASFYDGRPVVLPENVILNGEGDMTLPPTPFWQSPMAATLLLLAISIVIALCSFRKGKILYWWWGIFYTLLGLPGCVIFFLYFFSVHSATTPNLMILWLNPLQLLVPCLVWWRKGRPAVGGLMWLNMIVAIFLLVAWPFQSQSANPAIFPLLGADIILAATYAILQLRGSYNNIESEKGKLSDSPLKKTLKKNGVKPTQRRKNTTSGTRRK
ncbi:MAG: DUF4105 domain-containing protein [Muribaculaceae bacterium]|nr:DUF4105 domain-containing protein [Muribaculaceae bacterium]